MCVAGYFLNVSFKDAVKDQKQVVQDTDERENSRNKSNLYCSAKRQRTNKETIQGNIFEQSELRATSR